MDVYCTSASSLWHVRKVPPKSVFKKPLLIPIVDFRLQPLVDRGIMVESEEGVHQWNSVCVCAGPHTQIYTFTLVTFIGTTLSL